MYDTKEKYMYKRRILFLILVLLIFISISKYIILVYSSQDRDQYSPIINKYRLPFDQNAQVILKLRYNNSYCSLLQNNTYLIIKYINKIDKYNGILIINIDKNRLVYNKDEAYQLLYYYSLTKYYYKIAENITSLLPIIINNVSILINSTDKIIGPLGQIVGYINELKQYEIDVGPITLNVWDLIVEFYPDLEHAANLIESVYSKLLSINNNAREAQIASLQLYTTMKQGDFQTSVTYLQNYEKLISGFIKDTRGIIRVLDLSAEALEEIDNILDSATNIISSKIPSSTLLYNIMNIIYNIRSRVQGVSYELQITKNVLQSTLSAANKIVDMWNYVNGKAMWETHSYMDMWNSRIKAPKLLYSSLSWIFIAPYFIIMFLLKLEVKNIRKINAAIFVMILLSYASFILSLASSWVTFDGGLYAVSESDNDAMKTSLSSEICKNIIKKETNDKIFKDTINNIESLDGRSMSPMMILSNTASLHDIYDFGIYPAVVQDVQNTNQGKVSQVAYIHLILIILFIILLLINLFVGTQLTIESFKLIKQGNVTISRKKILLYILFQVLALTVFLLSLYPGKLLAGVKVSTYRPIYYGLVPEYGYYTTIIQPGIVFLAVSIILGLSAMALVKPSLSEKAKNKIKDIRIDLILFKAKIRELEREGRGARDFVLLLYNMLDILKLIVIQYIIIIFILSPIIFIKYNFGIRHDLSEMFGNAVGDFVYRIKSWLLSFHMFRYVVMNDRVFMILIAIIFLILALVNGIISMIFKKMSKNIDEISKRYKSHLNLWVDYFDFMELFFYISMIIVIVAYFYCNDGIGYGCLHFAVGEAHDLIFLLSMALAVNHFLTAALINDIKMFISIYDIKFPSTKNIALVWALIGLIPLLLPLTLLILFKVSRPISERIRVAKKLALQEGYSDILEI